MLLVDSTLRPPLREEPGFALAGTAGFGAAIGVHGLVGYLDLTHVGPAVLGGWIFLAGMILVRPAMDRHPVARAAAARTEIRRLMAFDVAAEAYDRFMGRYSRLLSPQMADLAGVTDGQRVVDVGCGPGVLTGELVRRVGAANVAAVDPSEPFVAAARVRQPGVDVRLASAESLPFPDDAFDAGLAQLVVHFMRDPIAGVREMARVTRAGGVVAACVWDFAGERAPLSRFWSVAHELDPGVVDESHLNGAREGHLVDLFGLAGLHDVEQAELSVTFEHAGFEEWWAPYLGGVSLAGTYVAGLSDEHRDALRDRLRARLPAGAFAVTSTAWAARGRV